MEGATDFGAGGDEAALRAAARATAGTAATEEIAEHIAEDVGEARPAETGASAPTHIRIDAGMAVLVVGRPLAGIGEDLVGLRHGLELDLRLHHPHRIARSANARKR